MNERPQNSEFAVPRRDAHEPAESSSTLEALTATARSLMQAVGYDRLTVEEVHRKAGVSKATFYFYFRNKKHLLMHLADDVMTDLYEVAGRHYPEKDEFSRIVLANVAYLQVWHRESRILGQFFALSLVDGSIHQVYQQYRARFEERIAGRIHRLVDQARIPLTDPELLAGTLSSMVEFSAFRYFCTAEQVGRAGVPFEELVRVLSESWYRAVYGRVPTAEYDYAQHKLEITIAEGK